MSGCRSSVGEVSEYCSDVSGCRSSVGEVSEYCSDTAPTLTYRSSASEHCSDVSGCRSSVGEVSEYCSDVSGCWSSVGEVLEDAPRLLWCRTDTAPTLTYQLALIKISLDWRVCVRIVLIACCVSQVSAPTSIGARTHLLHALRSLPPFHPERYECSVRHSGNVMKCQKTLIWFQRAGAPTTTTHLSVLLS